MGGEEISLGDYKKAYREVKKERRNWVLDNTFNCLYFG